MKILMKGEKMIVFPSLLRVVRMRINRRKEKWRRRIKRRRLGMKLGFGLIFDSIRGR
jgi:hypothetical protein